MDRKSPKYEEIKKNNSEKANHFQLLYDGVNSWK